MFVAPHSLKYKPISLHYYNGFGFTLNNRKVATKKSGTKKMAKTVAESIPPMGTCLDCILTAGTGAT
jgi:hypothetical protein